LFQKRTSLAAIAVIALAVVPPSAEKYASAVVLPAGIFAIL